MICGGSGTTGSHRFAYFLPEEIYPLRVAVGNDLLRETDMGDDFIENHPGGLLLRKVGRTRNEKGGFGELADDNEDGVETLPFLGSSPIKSMATTSNGCIGIGMG